MTRKTITCLVLTLLLSACNLNAPAGQDPNALSTAAALTVEAVLTPAATQPSSEAASPVPTATEACTNWSEIISWTRDGLTYDKAEVDKPLKPNQNFVMSWGLKNTGTCIWDSNYRLVFDSGTRLTVQDSIPVMPGGYRIDPGVELTINVQMTAPSEPGEYESSFRFVSADGNEALIVGVLTNVGSPVSQSLASPGDLRYTYDCSGGVVNITLNWADRSNDEAGFRIYRDGKKVGEVGAGTTSYSEIVPGVGTYQYTVAAFNATGEAPATVTVSTANCQ